MAKLKKKRMMGKKVLEIAGCKINQFFFKLFLLFLPLVSQGQDFFSKKFDKVLNGAPSVNFSHKNGPLTVLIAPDDKIKVEAEISFAAKNAADAEILFNRFRIVADQFQGQLNLLTNFDIKSWSSSNGKTQLVFNDGKKVENIKDLSIAVVLYLPEIDKLKLSQKYGAIALKGVSPKDLLIKLYDGKLEAETIEGNFYLEMKYSKADLKDVNNGEFTLLDSKVYGQNFNNLVLDSKYSKVQLLDVKTLDLNAHDDKFQFRSVGLFAIQDKYSDFTINSFGVGRMDIHDSSFSTEKGGTLKMKSKYSNVEIRELDHLDVELSYDDNLDIADVKTMVVDSKYTDFKIGKLGSKFIHTSYDDNVEIREISGPLEAIEFNGKYTDFSVGIPTNTKYRLEADITHGKFIYPEEDILKDFYVVKNEKMGLKGKAKGSLDTSPKIVIVSYDGKILLK